MKKTLIILAIILGMNANSQDKISFSIFQDIKLLMTDDEHHNKAITPDLIFNVDLQGNQFKTYFFSIKIQYEYAHLYSDDFHRYGFLGHWTFNTFSDKIHFGIGTGLSIIHRGKKMDLGALPSYSFNSEISFKINSKWSIVGKYEIVRRSDLKVFKNNSSIGLRFN